MDILERLPESRPRVRAVLFDFDGTLSTLRYGWESIMRPMMLELIAGDTPVDDALCAMVDEYIDQSTGIQTILQMQWLAETIAKEGRNPGMSGDPWYYKAEYNRRLMRLVSVRTQQVRSGEKCAGDYCMRGAHDFVKELEKRDVSLFVASGTDEADVRAEAELLGFAECFADISGAKPGVADCSKEAVLRGLIERHCLSGMEVAVVGDGKVEIALGREAGALCIGVAGDESLRGESYDTAKVERLKRAGTHVLCADYTQAGQLLELMNL